MAKTEVEKLREKYKSKIQKSKRKKSGGGLFALLIIVIIIGAIFGYFKFVYESPDSKEIRQKIGTLEDEFSAYQNDWEGNKIAINELNKIKDDIDELYIISKQRIPADKIEEVKKQFSAVFMAFDAIKMDLPKTRNIPKELTDLKEELDLYKDMVKKPSKEEKESLDNAQKLYEETEQKLTKAESIEDLNIVFEDIQRINSYLVIFETKIQLREAEWKEELSKVEGNVQDFDSARQKLKNWIECFSTVNKLWEELKKALEASKTVSKQDFNLKHLNDLKNQNNIIDKKFDEIFKTIEQFSKTGAKIDLPCEHAKTVEKEQGPPPKPIVTAPKIIQDTWKPGYISASNFSGEEKQAQVIVEILIDETGAVTEAKIFKSSGITAADQEAEKIVMNYKFEPGKDEDGKPGKCYSNFPVLIMGQ